ncbi:uncharacterized protein F4812DRAFT_47205 [Daldinia caldariorum]|uniref:uncharacterized protein n=1 Tax=Daldinia caldariorum TaxID=326644 RepID=UPI00200767B5|nr:uncharacterized protein F4812DRAFT_47205 [Daldinia caldariorum]KAI1467061.1 hypothetical protein F4812DRAFT_47205 [Daldinia caldariorum]
MADVSNHPHPHSHPARSPSGYRPEKPLSRELSLYNGVSNRSRGWKTKKSEKVEGMQTYRQSSVARWDGASMLSNGWDNLRRDPELWYHDGNCYIHLYGQGQSRRGPAFKVSFSGFLKAGCYPFIDRFMARDSIVTTGRTQENGDPARLSRIELFIPAPALDNQQSYEYHLATRNFIAYVFRRSMIGENLGAALITLVHSMHQFRVKDADNVQDLMDYLDEEGYLNLRSHPTHAIAILHLSEVFRLRSLYINAFAHCCGMKDQLLAVPEYQLLSLKTRKLIHCARVEMNLRLEQSANLVGTFLRCELAETHLSLYPGARSHLEKFRSLLHNFYVAKFGSYPPPSIDPETTIFAADVFRIMRADFEALFQYLVDESVDNTQNSSFLAAGGVCTWQSIQLFDRRHEFKTLPHPLPLLPRVSLENIKKVAWLEKRIKRNQRQREVTRSAFLKATNQRAELLKNGLVRVYRQFEEDLAHPSTKASKVEDLGPMDSRKVRWIQIYTVYQALRQATEAPPEVQDAATAPYHLCISTTDLPPWDEELPVHHLVRRQTIHIVHSTLPSNIGWDPMGSSPYQCSFEIKPDIDYFAITHRDRTLNEDKDKVPRFRRTASWRGSLSRSLSRSLTTRHSSAKLTKPQNRTAQSPWNRRHHEIVIQGYGNGTNGIRDALTDTVPPKARATIAEGNLESTSPSRNSSTSGLLRKSEDESIVNTLETSICESQVETSPLLRSGKRGGSKNWQSENRNNNRETLPHRPGSSFAAFRRKCQGEATSNTTCGLLRRRSKSIDGSSRKFTDPAPCGIRMVNSVTPHIEMPAPQTPTAWNHIKVMEAKATHWMTNDIQPAWEHYNDLGGLTELRPRGPHKPMPRCKPTRMVCP